MFRCCRDCVYRKDCSIYVVLEMHEVRDSPDRPIKCPYKKRE